MPTMMKTIHSLILALFIGMAGPVWAADDTHSCLTDLSGTITDVDGDQLCTQFSRNAIGNGERIDARTAFWQMQTDPDIGCPITFQTATVLDATDDTMCWAGGIIDGTNDVLASWADMHGPNTVAMRAGEGHMIWDGIRLDNIGDGIRPHNGGAGADLAEFEIRNSWFTFVRDDCIEHDNKRGGVVDDNLFDGCYVFLSARGASDCRPENTCLVVITNNLVRLQIMPEPFGHDGEPSVVGHGALFKFEGSSPDVELHDNIFLVEKCASTKFAEAGWCGGVPSVDGLGFQGPLTWSPSKLGDCTNNIIVWRGGGEYPGNDVTDTDCVTITTDIEVWNKARTRWINTHPRVERLSGDPDSTRPWLYRRRKAS